MKKVVYRKCGNAVTDSIKTEYEYPKSEIFTSQYYFPAIKEMQYKNNAFTGGKRLIFNKDDSNNNLFNMNQLVPIKEILYTIDGIHNMDSITTITYNSFYPDGNVETYTEKGKCMTKLFYETIAGAKRLVAKVTCASGYYNMTCNPTSADPKYIVSKNGISVFNMPNTQAVVYSYNTSGLVSSITSRSGQTLYYYYDDAMRLSEIKNQNGKTLNKYTYNYKNK